MNCRHAAVASLLVWYLMVPPYRLEGAATADPQWVVSYNVPVAKWTISGKFDSFDECHQNWAAEAITRIQPFQKLARGSWSKGQYGEYVALRAFLDALCVPSTAVVAERK